jgi:uncharacterized protein YndB with AHSA1/START domain
MRIIYKADHEIGGQTEKWYAPLDALGGPAAGRKALGEWLMKTAGLDAWWTTTVLVEYEKARNGGVSNGYNICVTKSISATPEAVYSVLADSAWWLGTGLQNGARFDDGDGHTGLVKKLTPAKLLRFTWEGAGHGAAEVVEIKLAAQGMKCGVTLTHTGLPDRAAADGSRAAWSGVLGRVQEKTA